MTEHQGLPVHGYQPQSDEKVSLVNEFKIDEETLLRKLDVLAGHGGGGGIKNADGTIGPADQRWLAIARTHFEQGFMALNRSVFKPMRVKLAGESDD